MLQLSYLGLFSAPAQTEQVDPPKRRINWSQINADRERNDARKFAGMWTLCYIYFHIHFLFLCIQQVYYVIEHCKRKCALKTIRIYYHCMCYIVNRFMKQQRHSQSNICWLVGLPPVKKNFYIENIEVANMDPAEVEEIRYN